MKKKSNKKTATAILSPEHKKMIARFARKAAPLYRYLGWEWYGEGVPDEKEIGKAASELLVGLLESRDTAHESGGISVRRNDDIIEISFRAISEEVWR
jgi:hypothetical protein